MAVQPRQEDHRNKRSAMARGALLTRVQDELAALRDAGARRCPLCGRPVRAAQGLEYVHGTAVHARCRRSRSS